MTPEQRAEKMIENISSHFRRGPDGDTAIAVTGEEYRSFRATVDLNPRQEEDFADGLLCDLVMASIRNDYIGGGTHIYWRRPPAFATCKEGNRRHRELYCRVLISYRAPEENPLGAMG